MKRTNKNFVVTINIDNKKLYSNMLIEFLNVLNFKKILIFPDTIEFDDSILTKLKIHAINQRDIFEKNGLIICLNVKKESIEFIRNLEKDIDLLILVDVNKNFYNNIIENYNKINPKELVKNNKVGLIIDFWITESSVSFYIDSKKYDISFIKSKINNLFMPF